MSMQPAPASATAGQSLLGTELGQQLLLRSGGAACARGGWKANCPIMKTLHHVLAMRAIGGCRQKPGGGAGGCSTLSPGERVDALTCFRPTRGMRLVDAMESRAYTCQHSNDGALLVCGFQDRRVRVYCTRSWHLVRDVRAHSLRWTVTDTALTADGRCLAYASITPEVHIVRLGDPCGGGVGGGDDGEGGLAGAAVGGGGGGGDDDDEGEVAQLADGDGVGVWSLRFSPCGRQLLAGANDCHFRIYDRERRGVVECVRAHADDVNSACFADDTGRLLFTASDDRLLKLWDRRCLPGTGGDARPDTCARPVGVLPGHAEGIAHVAPRGDGRYCATNGKDQQLKLWDVRKMYSACSFARLAPVPRRYHWDYRWMQYPGAQDGWKHPHDCSLMTYTGHSVLETLVRCHFSPERSTGQRYLYTGSQDGVVRVFDALTGDVVDELHFHRATVRDVSWHPTEMQLVSCSFDGTVAEWSHAHEGGGLTKAYRQRVKAEAKCARAGRRATTRRLERAVSHGDIFFADAEGGVGGGAPTDSAVECGMEGMEGTGNPGPDEDEEEEEDDDDDEDDDDEEEDLYHSEGDEEEEEEEETMYSEDECASDVDDGDGAEPPETMLAHSSPTPDRVGVAMADCLFGVPTVGAAGPPCAAGRAAVAQQQDSSAQRQGPVASAPAAPALCWRPRPGPPPNLPPQLPPATGLGGRSPGAGMSWGGGGFRGAASGQHPS